MKIRCRKGSFQRPSALEAETEAYTVDAEPGCPSGYAESGNPCEYMACPKCGKEAICYWIGEAGFLCKECGWPIALAAFQEFVQEMGEGV